LACQVTLRDDMQVEAPQEWVGATTYTCTVHSVTALTPLIREIVLQLPDEVDGTIVAGNYVQVSAPPYALDYASIDVPEAHSAAWQSIKNLTVRSDEEVTRAYSISNRPEDTAARRVVLNIRLALPPPSVPEAEPGIVSSWLFALQPGQEVTTSGPFGSFRAQPTDKEMVFIGGGVGMAPLRALIHEQLGIAKSGRKMSLWYGARSKAELLYVDELDALAAAHENFDWTVALSDPQPDDNWQGAVGFVHKVALDRYLRDHPEPENLRILSLRSAADDPRGVSDARRSGRRSRSYLQRRFWGLTMALSRRSFLAGSAALGLSSAFPSYASSFAFGGHAFGSTWRLTGGPNLEEARLRPLIEAVIQRVDRQMSPWRTDSDISRFNARPTTDWQALPAMSAVLSRQASTSPELQAVHSIRPLDQRSPDLGLAA
jgi:NAD(P)H-flavin reductase